MAYSTIKTERQDNYLTIILAQPEKGNQMTQTLLDELDAELSEAEQDRSLMALLLRAEGRHFCTGLDIKKPVVKGAAHAGPSVSKLFHHIEVMPIPTIAAINGAALGGGMQLPLHCDLRVAAEGARIGMPLAKIGLAPTFDIVRKLVEVAGAPGANQLLFTAEPISGRRAYEMGIVHEVVADDKLEEAGHALARKVAANAPLALRTDKAAIRRAMVGMHDTWHEDINRMIQAVEHSADLREGFRAFVEKRKPVWRSE